MNGVSKISESRKRLEGRLGRFSASERALIGRAFEVARTSHEGQLRRTGEPYVCHSIEVAVTLCDWKLDAPSVAAALLHDVLEDTPVTLPDLRREFGDEVAELVESVTKLSSVRMPQTEVPFETENLRRLFLAMASDLRVVLLKLADRLHNVRTITGLRPEKRVRFARETIEIFAPLADGLGMGEVRAELADRGFEYAEPEEYRKIKRRVESAIVRSNRYLAAVKREFAKVLKAEGVKAQIDSRAKTLYSLHRKLQEKQRDLDKVYDLFAVRVIVDNVEDCYRGMGVIHRTWQPLPHRIKDYIAVPKSNGYRSLHTTVFGPQNRLLEVQFRTWKMHEEAEHGIAAHAVYAEGKRPKRATEEQSAMMKRLKSWQDEMAESVDFVQRFKLDLFSDRIFIFTPKGQLHSLPAESCPVDFAYAVHTEVGHACRGAKVNGVIVPLDASLKNGDVVEVLRGKGGPNRDWLRMVRTGHARGAIRRYFRTADRGGLAAEGKRAFETLRKQRRLPADPTPAEWSKLVGSVSGARTREQVLSAIGEGRLSLAAVERLLGATPTPPPSRRPTARRRPGSVTVDRQPGLPSQLARCCKPAPPARIVGYVTLQKVVSVHRESCRQVQGASDPTRLVSAHWER